MSGTTKGKIECLHNTGSGDNNGQEMFINLYDHWKNLETAGYATEIANNYGNGGTGFDYWDGTNPSGDNAFFVFKLNQSGSGRTYTEPYILIQHSTAANFGSSPGNPAKIAATTGATAINLGVAIAWAVESDGTTAANPWNGGTSKAGSDSKGTPVWVPPSGGTVHCFPRSNNAGGSYATNRENCTAMMLASTGHLDTRIHMVGDRDFFYWVMDYDDTGEYSWSMFFGAFTPRQNTTWNHPMVFFADAYDVPPVLGTSYGNTTGASTRQGGVMTPSVSDGVKAPIEFSQVAAFWDVAIHPNTLVNEYDEMPIPFGCYEGAFYGLCGQLPDVLQHVYDIAIHDTNTAKTRVIVADDATLAHEKLTMPWDGTTTPRSGTTRAGVDF